MIEIIAAFAVGACVVTFVMWFSDWLIRRRQNQFREAVKRQDWPEVDRVLGIWSDRHAGK